VAEARRLEVSPATVRRWRDRGILRAHPEYPHELRADDVELVVGELERLREQGVASSRWARELAAKIGR